MISSDPRLLPSGRPVINLRLLLTERNHPDKGRNDCTCFSLTDPHEENHAALLKGLQRILPYMYRTREQVINILDRHGMNFAGQIPANRRSGFAQRNDLITLSEFYVMRNTSSVISRPK